MRKFFSQMRFPFVLVHPDYQAERLRNTCFRPDACKAGNFAFFRSVNHILEQHFFLNKLVVDVQLSIGELAASNRTRGTFTSSLVSGRGYVGWVSTVKSAALPPGTALVACNPNEGTTAMRVLSEEVMAPRTRMLTFIYEIKPRTIGVWSVVIHSVYPGPALELGSKCFPLVIPPETAVFIPWSNPGVPLAGLKGVTHVV